MRWIDICSSALHNLFRRRLRSVLTMLGVVIGTCAIIVTLSLGYGAEEAQMQLLEQSTNLRMLQVYPYYSYSEDSSSAAMRRISKITDSVVAQIRSLHGVAAVTPLVNFYPNGTFTLHADEYSAYAYFTAVIPQDFYKLVHMESGTGFTGRTDRMEFLLNEVYMCEFRESGSETYVDTWTYLMNGTPLPTPPIRWLKTDFKLRLTWSDYAKADPVTGKAPVYTQDSSARCVGTFAVDANDWTFSSGPIVSLNWLKRYYRENRDLYRDLGITDQALNQYDNVYVLAKSVDDVEGLVRDLKEMGVQCYSPMEYVNTFKEQLNTMQSFLGFIGAVSMLVAALSIANTMMMSIYERTREIGVMKVLGCSLGNIRAMFLCEAAFIGLLGGMLGMAFSYALSYALNNVTWLQSIISSVMASATLFSSEGTTVSNIPPALALGTWGGVIVVSILSGFYPAQRAMRLSSLSAIRNAE